MSITGNKNSFVPHLPFSVAGLEKSVVELTEEEQQFELADDRFGEGYGSWNAAHQQGKAGVFTAETSEILEGVVKNLAER